MDIMKIGGIALIAIIGIFFLLPALSDMMGGSGGSLGGGATGGGGNGGSGDIGLPQPINIFINIPDLYSGSGKETSQLLEREGVIEGSKYGIPGYDIPRQSGQETTKIISGGTHWGKDTSTSSSQGISNSTKQITNIITNLTGRQDKPVTSYREAGVQAYGSDVIGRAYGGEHGKETSQVSSTYTKEIDQHYQEAQKQAPKKIGQGVTW